MCVDPATLAIISAVTSGLGTVASYAGSQQQAKQQNRLIDDAARQNEEARITRANEVNQEAAEEKSDVAQAALKERARLRASAGEAGNVGLTLDSLLSAAGTEEATALSRIDVATTRTQEQLRRQGSAAETQVASQKTEVANNRQGVFDLASGLGKAYVGYKTDQAKLGKLPTK